MAPAPEKITQEGFVQGVMVETFLQVSGYVDKGALTLNTYHLLFKLTNLAEEEDGPKENGRVFSFCGHRNEEGGKPQLFKPAQENCFK